MYILIEYQHPEDRNQAWFPKIVVVFGLTLAVCSVLMFPLVGGARVWVVEAAAAVLKLRGSLNIEHC